MILVKVLISLKLFRRMFEEEETEVEKLHKRNKSNKDIVMISNDKIAVD